jgi:hypothetical protein
MNDERWHRTGHVHIICICICHPLWLGRTILDFEVTCIIHLGFSGTGRCGKGYRPGGGVPPFLQDIAGISANRVATYVLLPVPNRFGPVLPGTVRRCSKSSKHHHHGDQGGLRRTSNVAEGEVVNSTSTTSSRSRARKHPSVGH